MRNGEASRRALFSDIERQSISGKRSGGPLLSTPRSSDGDLLNNTSVAVVALAGLPQAKADMPPRRHTLLGVTLDAVTSEQLIDAAIQQVERGQGTALFGHHNLHSLHLFHKQPEMQQFYALNTLTHMDGMSLVWLGSLMGLPVGRHHRTTYLDWIEDFLAKAAARRWKIYILGGPPDVAAMLPGMLQTKYPGLRVKTHHGYVTANEDHSIQNSIQDFAPEIVMVGMGMPRQEFWIVRNLPSLHVPIVFSCGAAFEYLAGVKQRPPRWAGRLGIEWLFRLVSEPRRLASRYLVEPIHLLPLLIREATTRLRA